MLQDDIHTDKLCTTTITAMRLSATTDDVSIAGALPPLLVAEEPDDESPPGLPLLPPLLDWFCDSEAGAAFLSSSFLT